MSPLPQRKVYDNKSRAELNAVFLNKNVWARQPHYDKVVENQSIITKQDLIEGNSVVQSYISNFHKDPKSESFEANYLQNRVIKRRKDSQSPDRSRLQDYEAS